MKPGSLKVGDLLKIKSASRSIVMEYGIFLGMETTWKEWHRVWINGKEYKFDEPFWELKVISKI